MPVYTVSQISHYLKESLEGDNLLGDLWVTGEVSNLRTAPSGHSYFTLKDSQVQLRSVMFKGGRGADLLAGGDLVTVHGRISFYEARGDVQILADLVMPEGTGPLHLELENLKMHLEEEGLFEASRKRPLPRFPHVIGVVTSPAGAVFHDICNVIGRRYPLVEILLAPTLVQGDTAAPQIVRAIKALNEEGRSDVIILGRGGGSLEELWPFNEEQVARAVHASRIPVVSAVGHETDYTIADYVADLRAPTPSAAAEMVVPDGNALQQDILALREALNRALTAYVGEQRYALRTMAAQVGYRSPDIATWRRRVDDLARSAYAPLSERLTSLTFQISGYSDRLQALNPQAILQRGYAIVETQPDGQVVRSKNDVAVGDQLKVTVADGSLPATVGTGHRKTRPRKGADPAGARLV